MVHTDAGLEHQQLDVELDGDLARPRPSEPKMVGGTNSPQSLCDIIAYMCDIIA